MSDKPSINVSARDERMAAMQRACKEARLVARMVRVQRGKDGYLFNDARKQAVLARMRKRLIAMVEQHDREGVGYRS